MDITGRKLFVKALREEGVDTIFGYPGGMVTDIFDELYKQEDIQVVLPRHEQGMQRHREKSASVSLPAARELRILLLDWRMRITTAFRLCVLPDKYHWD